MDQKCFCFLLVSSLTPFCNLVILAYWHLVLTLKESGFIFETLNPLQNFIQNFLRQSVPKLRHCDYRGMTDNRHLERCLLSICTWASFECLQLTHNIFVSEMRDECGKEMVDHLIFAQHAHKLGDQTPTVVSVHLWSLIYNIAINILPNWCMTWQQFYSDGKLVKPLKANKLHLSPTFKTA